MSSFVDGQWMMLHRKEANSDLMAEAAPEMLESLRLLDSELACHFWQPSADGATQEQGDHESIRDYAKGLSDAWSNTQAMISRIEGGWS